MSYRVVIKKKKYLYLVKRHYDKTRNDKQRQEWLEHYLDLGYTRTEAWGLALKHPTRYKEVSIGNVENPDVVAYIMAMPKADKQKVNQKIKEMKKKYKL